MQVGKLGPRQAKFIPSFRWSAGWGFEHVTVWSHPAWLLSRAPGFLLPCNYFLSPPRSVSSLATGVGRGEGMNMCKEMGANERKEPSSINGSGKPCRGRCHPRACVTSLERILLMRVDTLRLGISPPAFKKKREDPFCLNNTLLTKNLQPPGLCSLQLLLVSSEISLEQASPPPPMTSRKADFPIVSRSGLWLAIVVCLK